MSAIKAHDSVVAVLFATRAASALLPVAVRSGVSPNALTLLSLALTLVAAYAMTVDSAATAIVAAALIEIGFVVDCLDGQLARATRRTSDFGAYLDSMTDLAKVFLLLFAAGAAAGAPADAALAGWSFLWFALCQHHVHVTKTFPQRAQSDYEEEIAPWKARLSAFGQQIDVAFAIGEVLTVLALGALFRRHELALRVLAILLPIQFASYAIRFWRHRYERPA
ncbi:MAG: CDP-alcohol phosphatidyltransferase family protein [Candidatus Binatia bacterium]